MTIVNLRGTNGSGKSTVARKLFSSGAGAKEIDLAPYYTPKGQKRYVIGYEVPENDLIVVGSYRTECGGCDAIKTQDLVCEAVRHASGLAAHVFFEGVIVSTLFSRYMNLSKELGGLVWAYMDTPLDVCLERISRRNGGKAIKTELVANKLRSINNTRLKASLARERVADIDHERAVEQVWSLF